MQALSTSKRRINKEEETDEDHSKWDSAIRPWAIGMVHRHGSDRSAIRRERQCSCCRKRGDVRARRAHCLAHAPVGSTLIITFGRGWVQREGRPVEEVRPGDVVWFEAGEKHWHGASDTTAMQHIAIQEALEHAVRGAIQNHPRQISVETRRFFKVGQSFFEIVLWR